MLIKNLCGLWFIGWAVFAVVSKSDLAVHTLQGNFVAGLFCAFTLPGIGVSMLATGGYASSAIIYPASIIFWLIVGLLTKYRRTKGPRAAMTAMPSAPGVIWQYRRRTFTRYEED